MKKILLLCLLTFSLGACKKTETVAEIPKSSDKTITSVTLLTADNPALPGDVTGLVNAGTVKFDIPGNVIEREFVLTFKLAAKSKLYVGTVEQISGTTKVNFANTVTFTVKAEDGTSSDYAAQVIKLGISPLANVNNTTSYYYKSNAKTWINYATKVPQTLKFYPGGYLARAFYDFDKDGDEDLLMGNLSYIDGVGLSSTPRPINYLSNDGGVYVEKSSSKLVGTPGLVHPRKAILGDFDKNGWMDAVLVGHGYDKPPFPGEKAKLLMNNNGVFTSSDMGFEGSFYHSASSGDIDNDGDIDVFFTDTKGVSKLFTNGGSGNFSLNTDIFPSTVSNLNYFTSEIYDLNKDGYLDLVIAGHEHENAKTTVFWGSYLGKYSTSNSNVITGISQWGIVIDINFIDVNGDGKEDIILDRQGDGTGAQKIYHGLNIQILTQNANGSFTDATSSLITNNIVLTDSRLSWFWVDWLRCFDIDNDGDKDIVTEDKYYNLQWRNDNGKFVKF
ncbi:MAG: VCBS repeat-containing protein [Daejeonella sp.]|uniref:FG-GAP repeat domain-containing protein n=1 Tax=Daejeonella sp. TaxID=2805397 RepID=UPI003C7235C1